MPWLIFKRSDKKKTSSRSKKKATTGLAASWTPERTVKVLRWSGWLAVALGLTLGWYFGEKSLKQYVRDRQRKQVNPDHVTLADRPAWMGDWLDADLSAVVASRVGSDPMDGKSLVDAATALEQNPWVARVHRIERQPDQKIVVHATYHQPTAVIGSRRGYHLVTHRGIVLPGVYEAQQLAALGLPVIQGVSASPAPEGTIWPGDDVEAGLDVVALLRGEWFGPQIRTIDVHDRDKMGRITVKLITHDDGVFIWGMPPGQEFGLEEPPEVKLGRLDRHARNHNGLHTDGETSINTPRAWRQSAGSASVGYTSMQ